MTSARSKRFHAFSSYIPALLVPLAILSGCRGRERERAESEPPRVVSLPRTEIQPVIEVAKPQPVAVFPIRRALSTPASSAPPMETAPTCAIAFSLSMDGEQIRLRATLAHTGGAEADVIDELKALGFQNTSDRTWIKTLVTSGRAAFEQQVLTRIEAASSAAEGLASDMRRAGQPGRLLIDSQKQPGAFLPTITLYTGNFMDVALARPEIYLAVENVSGAAVEPGYCRGGRLYVDSGGRIGIENFRLPGEWKSVPADAVQVVIKPDGRVMSQQASGDTIELGRLQVYRIAKIRIDKNDLVQPAENSAAQVIDPQMAVPALPGHLEFSRVDPLRVAAASARRQILDKMLDALARPVPVAPVPNGNPTAVASPIVVHADLPWTERHLKALGVNVERTPGRTTITPGENPSSVAAQLTKVLQVLRLRMSVHEQNIRNAERVRDADNRLNPYRRKILKIGPQGEPLEEVDSSPLPKVSKPGDPNADADGFVTLPNVNRAVEAADFQAAAEEYRMIRTVMERLDPHSVFPDPIALPPLQPKAEAP
ncbi:MAG TPA: hypothetical protein VEK08_19955 [Planctomycetota bacterium]|nr:hypothetical protein [Planctomycetota bacterium]